MFCAHSLCIFGNSMVVKIHYEPRPNVDAFKIVVYVSKESFTLETRCSSHKSSFKGSDRDNF